jgi:hypothetical protein
MVKIGVLEYWSNGVMEKTGELSFLNPILQHSSTPL